MLAHAEINDAKAVLLVTADRKEDWWWREKGKTVGPRPELIREAQRVGKIDLFWMYSPVQFLENAKRFTKAQVSDSLVKELSQVVRIHSSYYSLPDPEIDLSHATWEEVSLAPPRLAIEKSEEAVSDWLQNHFKGVQRNIGVFPNFIVPTINGPHGFDVKYIRNFVGFRIPMIVIHALSRGYVEINEDRLSNFTLVIVVESRDWADVTREGASDIVRKKLMELIMTYPVTRIMLGTVNVQGEFSMVVQVRNPSRED
jgi:hypothetical protein